MKLLSFPNRYRSGFSVRLNDKFANIRKVLRIGELGVGEAGVEFGL